MASPQAKADAAKAALASTATCTTATVVTLKELLLPDTETSSTTSQTNSRTTSRAAAHSKAKKTTAARTKSSEEQLSAKDRAALATNVINIAIKSLTEAAKPAPPSTPTLSWRPTKSCGATNVAQIFIRAPITTTSENLESSRYLTEHILESSMSTNSSVNRVSGNC
ncbi:separin protein [Fusarium solani]|nr:separin protein [Fusarium solani]